MSYTPVKRQDFVPSCPSGGTWWACGYGTYFVGCCARDPCDITCAQGNLYPGAFNPTSYGEFPDATCGTGSKFYTCAAGQTFWGCCKTNACSQSGCPDGDLEPAILNREDLRSAYHATGGTTLTSATRTSTTSSTAPSRTSDTATTATPATLINSSEPKNHVAAIAGGAAGGAFGLAVILALLIYYFCHAKKSRKGHTDTVVRRLSDLPAMTAEKDKRITPLPSDAAAPPPPDYSSPNPNYPQQLPPLNPSQYAPYAYTTTQQQQYRHHQHGAYPLHSERQELPIEPLSPIPFSQKNNPEGYHYQQHRRDLSELSGETAVRSELGIPLPSPTGFVPSTRLKPTLGSGKGFGQQNTMTPQQITYGR
ncbi:Nn.00g037340.m01.CDS01 [Neocucurbitaria sp. VM-36]